MEVLPGPVPELNHWGCSRIYLLSRLWLSLCQPLLFAINIPETLQRACVRKTKVSYKLWMDYSIESAQSPLPLLSLKRPRSSEPSSAQTLGQAIRRLDLNAHLFLELRYECVARPEKLHLSQHLRAVRYDDIYRMDEIKSLIVSYYALSFISWCRKIHCLR